MGQSKKKRKLTDKEIDEVRLWLLSSPQDHKPSIRIIARRYKVSRTSVIKSLGGWKNIQRNRPLQEKKERVIDRNIQSPVTIEPHTVQLDEFGF